METDSLPEPASSGHSTNCSFWHFCIGFIQVAAWLQLIVFQSCDSLVAQPGGNALLADDRSGYQMSEVQCMLPSCSALNNVVSYAQVTSSCPCNGYTPKALPLLPREKLQEITEHRKSPFVVIFKDLWANLWALGPIVIWEG